MRKFGFLLFLIIALTVQATAQLIYFPTGVIEKPKTKLKGAVHTVLTIEQRGEYVFSTVVEVYDLKGRLTETMNSNANIEIHSGNLVRLGDKTIYAFDASGKLVKANEFTPEGQFTGYETFTFDAKNRLTENILFNRDNKERGRRVYAYFPERREIVATVSYDYGGRITPFKVLFSYDEKEQLTKRVHYESDGSESNVTTFEYDANGNITKETPRGTFNSPHLYSYKLDKQGNWIERQDTQVQLNKSGKEELDPDWMRTYRVITYYSDNETKP
jgi:YD repeat-containing protein